MISMLITTLDRGALLERSLARLEELTPPDQLVVVNDGGSNDRLEAVAEFGRRTGADASLVYLDNPGRTICSKARNEGLRHCRHEVVLTSEPEVFFRSDVVAQAPALMQAHPSAVLTPGTVFYAPGDWNGDLDNPGEQQHGEWIPPYIGLWRKEWLDHIGGWDEGFPAPWGGEDIDLFARLAETGYERHQAPELDVVHQDHGGGSVEQKMEWARENSAYLYAKPYWHGHAEHRCSRECQQGRRIIL